MPILEKQHTAPLHLSENTSPEFKIGEKDLTAMQDWLESAKNIRAVLKKQPDYQAPELLYADILTPVQPLSTNKQQAKENNQDKISQIPQSNDYFSPKFNILTDTPNPLNTEQATTVLKEIVVNSVEKAILLLHNLKLTDIASKAQEIKTDLENSPIDVRQWQKSFFWLENAMQGIIYSIDQKNGANSKQIRTIEVKDGRIEDFIQKIDNLVDSLVNQSLLPEEFASQGVGLITQAVEFFKEPAIKIKYTEMSKNLRGQRLSLEPRRKEDYGDYDNALAMLNQEIADSLKELKKDLKGNL